MKRTTSAHDGQGRPLGQVLDSLSLDQRLLILEHLALQLAQLHERQEWYGALGLDTVILTDEGLVQLQALAQVLHKRNLTQARAYGMAFDEPCAAPEQYVDDPTRPAGPWTDVYGYAALRWHLTTGAPLTAAPWRQLRDPVGMDEEADGPTQAMLQGLALDWVQRPQSMLSYRRLERLGQVSDSVSEQTALARPVLPIRTERRAFGWRWLGGLALLLVVGLAVGYWSTGGEESGSLVATTESGQALMAETLSRGAAPKGQEGQADLRGLPTAEGSVQAVSEPVAALPNTSSEGEPSSPPGLSAAVSGQGQEGGPVALQAVQPVTTDAIPSLAPMSAQASVSAGQARVQAVEPAAEAVQVSGMSAGLDALPSQPAQPEQASEEPSRVPRVEPTPADTAKPEAVAPTQAAPTAKGTVVLDVRPWGEIYVNGRKQGVSPPLKSLSLPAGTHRILIKNAGLPPFSSTVRVRSGQTASVKHAFN